MSGSGRDGRTGLPRGVHTSVYALEKDIRDWITNWNENPKPFIRPRLIWTTTADEILERLASYLHGIPGAGRYGVARVVVWHLRSALTRPVSLDRFGIDGSIGIPSRSA
jgi:hypothetical protein